MSRFRMIAPPQVDPAAHIAIGRVREPDKAFPARAHGQGRKTRRAKTRWEFGPVFWCEIINNSERIRGRFKGSPVLEKIGESFNSCG